MPVIEELDDSDEEEEVHAPAGRGGGGQRGPGSAGAGAPEDFNSMLQKASQIKTAQLKEKRRVWEESPDFLRNTMAHERPEEWVALRAGPFEDRLAACEAYKAEGNELYSFKKKPEEALAAYTKAVAVFRLFRRSEASEHIRWHATDEELPIEQRSQAREALLPVYLNCAACLLRLKQPRDALYAASEALAIDGRSAKGLYRRAMARVALETAEDLELAVRDLTRAAELAPQDASVRAALREHRKHHVAQRRADRAAYGAALGSELYSEADRDAVTRVEPPKAPPPDPTAGMSDEELIRRAKQAGVDLADPKVRKEFEGRAAERKRREVEAKAKEMGIDLSDPKVQQYIELMEQERREGLQPGALAGPSGWRRVVTRALDPDKAFNLQRVVYVALAANVAWRIYNVVTRASGGGAHGEEEGLDGEDGYQYGW